VDLVDFFPRPKNAKVISKGPKQGAYREMTSVQEELKQWLVRRVECIRGRLQLGQYGQVVKGNGTFMLTNSPLTGRCRDFPCL
jgi:hypothetical protein